MPLDRMSCPVTSGCPPIAVTREVFISNLVSPLERRRFVCMETSVRRAAIDPAASGQRTTWTGIQSRPVRHTSASSERRATCTPRAFHSTVRTSLGARTLCEPLHRLQHQPHALIPAPIATGIRIEVIRNCRAARGRLYARTHEAFSLTCGTPVVRRYMPKKRKGGQPLHKHKHAPPGERKPKPKVPKQKPPRPPPPKPKSGLQVSSSSASSTSDEEELRSASKASKPSADASPRSSTPLVETPLEKSTRQLKKTRKKLRELARLSGKGRSQLDVQQQRKLDRRGWWCASSGDRRSGAQCKRRATRTRMRPT